MGQEIMGLNCKKEQVKLDLRGKKIIIVEVCIANTCCPGT